MTQICPREHSTVLQCDLLHRWCVSLSSQHTSKCSHWPRWYFKQDVEKHSTHHCPPAHKNFLSITSTSKVPKELEKLQHYPYPQGGQPIRCCQLPADLTAITNFKNLGESGSQCYNETSACSQPAIQYSIWFSSWCFYGRSCLVHDQSLTQSLWTWKLCGLYLLWHQQSLWLTSTRPDTLESCNGWNQWKSAC